MNRKSVLFIISRHIMIIQYNVKFHDDKVYLYYNPLKENEIYFEPLNYPQNIYQKF